MRIYTKEWVFGYLVVDPNGGYRIYFKPFEYASSNTWYYVIPETVGQFTGLLDRNGKKVFEGDILKHPGFTQLLTVAYDKQRAMFVCKRDKGETGHVYGYNAEIIGTIHDNTP